MAYEHGQQGALKHINKLNLDCDIEKGQLRAVYLQHALTGIFGANLFMSDLTHLSNLMKLLQPLNYSVIFVF